MYLYIRSINSKYSSFLPSTVLLHVLFDRKRLMSTGRARYLPMDFGDISRIFVGLPGDISAKDDDRMAVGTKNWDIQAPTVIYHVDNKYIIFGNHCVVTNYHLVVYF